MRFQFFSGVPVLNPAMHDHVRFLGLSRRRKSSVRVTQRIKSGLKAADEMIGR